MTCRPSRGRLALGAGARPELVQNHQVGKKPPALRAASHARQPPAPARAPLPHHLLREMARGLLSPGGVEGGNPPGGSPASGRWPYGRQVPWGNPPSRPPPPLVVVPPKLVEATSPGPRGAWRYNLPRLSCAARTLSRLGRHHNRITRNLGEEGLPSADRNNKATLLLTGPFRATKSYAKDSSPRASKLQFANHHRDTSRPVGRPPAKTLSRSLFLSV
jgi:hypothetical protein